MESIAIYRCVACLFAALTGASVASILVSAHATVRRRARVARGENTSTWMLATLLQKGVRPCMPVALRLVRLRHAEGVFTEGMHLVRTYGYEVSAASLCSVWCVFVLVSVFAGSLIGRSLLFGLALAACVNVVAWCLLERQREKRMQAMREGVPGVLRAMEACFMSGLTLLQTFQHLATEAPPLLAPLFADAAHELEAGCTPKSVLASLRKKANVPELAFIALALEIQYVTGGSMRQVLAAARDSIESDLELRRTLQVQTAQAALSARVVTALPFVLIALLSLVTENFLAPFFSSLFGMALLAVGVFMEVAGVLCVRSMLKVGVAQ